MAVPPPPPVIDKPGLRTRLRAVRAAFVREMPVTAITPPPRFLAVLRPDMIVASYLPIGSEADPALLGEAALAAGATLALPHVTDREAPLRFLAWHPDHGSVPGPFNLRQPHGDGEAVAPDLILTPLLAFDARLARLGQGAGHYDRAFAMYPAAIRIGVAWSVQQVDMMPADPWDVPLHAVVTEQGWIEKDAQ
jgi:5-formyltetrahydrofolate cyclo-ligase